MEQQVGFSWDFKILLGYSVLDWVIIIGLIVIASILFRWATSYLKTPLKEKIRNVAKWILYVALYGCLLLVLVDKILREEYIDAFIFAFFALLPQIKSLVEYLYKRYDAFIDKLADKI